MTCNLKNQRFNSLVAVEQVRDDRGRVAWRCVCDCGGEKIVLTGTLRHKPPPNCGCRHMGTKHGHGPRNSQTWRAWNSMKQRCYNAKTKAYPNYGGRGIRVCDRWHSFENFLADMGEAPTGLTLDRIDNSGDYEPGNCEWRTRKHQARNRRNNKLITFRGETLCVSEWAERLGVSKGCLIHRLKHGWKLEIALTLPAKRNR